MADFLARVHPPARARQRDRTAGWIFPHPFSRRPVHARRQGRVAWQGCWLLSATREIMGWIIHPVYGVCAWTKCTYRRLQVVHTSKGCLDVASQLAAAAARESQTPSQKSHLDTSLRRASDPSDWSGPTSAATSRPLVFANKRSTTPSTIPSTSTHGSSEPPSTTTANPPSTVSQLVARPPTLACPQPP